MAERGRGGDAGSDVLRVLLVDDNPNVLQLLSRLCVGDGCLVTAASTAEEALAIFAASRFDLIVSDLMMPGLSGLDLLREVKCKQPSTPVVLITGVPSVDSAAFGLRHGAYDYLSKPFAASDVRQLLQRVRTDRRMGNGRLNLAAGLTEEVERWQLGVESLFHIGELALEDMESTAFLDAVLGATVQHFRCDGALAQLRQDAGPPRLSRHGAGEVVAELGRLVQGAFAELVQTAGRRVLTLVAPESGITALVALVPGTAQTMSVLCVGRRSTASGAFLPHERDLFQSYAQATAVALQKLLLRESVQQNLIDTISSFVNALESKDPYLKGHSARVSMYARELASAMGMAPAEVEIVARGGTLHDLGKLGTLDHILRMPRRLTAEEFELVKDHTVAGDKILKPLRFLAREARAARNHHERYDGRGYPDRLLREDIPLIARIVSVADAFDAMTSDRPYRSALGFEAAIAEITRGSGHQFDPAAAAVFTAIPPARLRELGQSWTATDAALDVPLAGSLDVLARLTVTKV